MSIDWSTCDLPRAVFVSSRQPSGHTLEFAVSKDDMETFGVLDLATSFEGCRFAIGIRNANNERFRPACTVGLRVFVCHNLAFRGDYSPVLAKHSKHFSLEDALSVGVDRKSDLWWKKDFVCAKSGIGGTDSGAYRLVARPEYQYSNLFHPLSLQTQNTPAKKGV